MVNKREAQYMVVIQYPDENVVDHTQIEKEVQAAIQSALVKKLGAPVAASVSFQTSYPV